MLDLQNFDQDETESSRVTAEPRYSSVRYENITPSAVGSKVGGRPEGRLSPENRITESATGQTPPTTTCGHEGAQKATVYENVIISALGVPEPIMSIEHPYNVPPPKANISTSGAEPPRPPRADGRDFRVGPVEDESGYTLVDETSKKLGIGGVIVSTRLPDCYEEHRLNASQSDSQGHVTQNQSNETSPSKRNASRRREEVYESVKVGGVNGSSSKQCPPSTTTPHVNGMNGTSDESDWMQQSTSIIDNSRDNPFAGLVLSASRQLEESLPQTPPTIGISPSIMAGGGVVSEEAPGRFRGRVDTVWDDVRMQKEWTQVRETHRCYVHFMHSKWQFLHISLLGVHLCCIEHFLHMALSGIHFVLYRAVFAHGTLGRTFCVV